MNDQLLMNVIDPLNDLPDYSTHLGFLHSPVLSQHLQQLSTCAILNEQVNVLFVLEVPVKWSDVSMGQIKLNAQLSSDLALILLVPNLLFLHNLHTA